MSAVVGVIQQFLHPPIGAMHLEVIPGAPFSGLNGLTRTRGPIGVDAMGIRWLITAFPPGYGLFTAAGANLFDREVIDIATQHQLIVGGDLVVTQEETSRRVAGHVLFTESFPFIVNVELSPGVQASLWWLVVF